MPLTTDRMTEIMIASPADQITVLNTGSASSAAPTGEQNRRHRTVEARASFG